MSFENANITLPEIHIRKFSHEVVSSGLVGPIGRSKSLPNSTSHVPDTNTLFPTKYFEPKNAGLSEVSDIEENEQDCSVSPEYVHKLKLKLKSCTAKIRDRNKIIQNQNEDIDNFLEDIANKENTIINLREEIELLRQQEFGLQDQTKSLRKQTSSIEIGLCEVKTPSFGSISEVNLTRELIDLVEECCQEISCLKGLVENAPSPEEVKELEIKLQASFEKVNQLRAKLARCVQLGLISPSVSHEERHFYPNILEVPGKTVNEIKTENELLILYNEELKQENEELREQILNGGEPHLHSSMFQENVTVAEHGCDEDTNKDELMKLTSEVKALMERLKTSEAQIEKDWEIIESQGNQLDNLHQQFIEQRDENLKHQRMLKDRDDEIEKLTEESHGFKQNEQNPPHLEDLYVQLTEQQEEIQQLQNLITKKDQDLMELSKEVIALEHMNTERKQIFLNAGGVSIDSLDQTNTDIIYTESENMNGKVKTLELKKMQEKHESEVEVLKKQHQSDHDKLQEEHQSMIKQFEKQHQTDLDQLQREHYTQIKKFQEMLEDKEHDVNKLCEDIVEVRQRAKTREEELERILEEKEKGIDKLHSMIRELERSLSNSQFHIEGILKDSLENREIEETKDHLLKEQEVLIANLKQQLLHPPKATEPTIDIKAMRPLYKDLFKCLHNAKIEYKNLREQVCLMQTELNLYVANITGQLKQYLENVTKTSLPKHNGSPESEENNGILEFLSPASSDSEALFVPRHSSGDSFNPSPVDDSENRSSDESQSSSKCRKFENEKQQLIEKHNAAFKRKDSMHKLQIDTIIRSLAKRHIRKPRPFLTPSPELFMASNERLERSEFLKNCFSKVKYSSDGGF